MFGHSTMLAFALDELIAALAILDDGWLHESERAGMRQAAIEVVHLTGVAVEKPDRAPVVRAAYASLLAFAYALGRAAEARRVDLVAVETCRESITEMLDALEPLLDGTAGVEVRRAS